MIGAEKKEGGATAKEDGEDTQTKKNEGMELK